MTESFIVIRSRSVRILQNTVVNTDPVPKRRRIPEVGAGRGFPIFSGFLPHSDFVENLVLAYVEHTTR